jgi:hypothetical protein
VTESQPTRTNRNGDPCPSWCTTDHNDGSSVAGTHVSHAGGIDFGDRGLDSIWASPILGEYHDGRPHVAVTGHRYRQSGSPQLQVRDIHAESVADLIDMLADATPDQHRELAAAIRQAAAQITAAGGAQ